MEQPTLEIAVHNDPAGLLSASEAARNLLAEHGVAEEHVRRSLIILDELGSNIARHAWPDRGLHVFVVRIAVGAAGSVELEFEDDGRPFDPTAIDRSPVSGSLEELTPGGLGLLLVNRLARSLAYRRVSDRNLIRVEVASEQAN